MIALTEIGSNADACTGLLEGYDFVFVKPQGNSNFGGAGMYIRDDVNYKIRSDVNVHLTNSRNYVEMLCIDICLPESSYTLLIIYRHPNKGNIPEFQSDLENIFQHLRDEGNNVIIVGDLNINLLNMQNENTKNYVNNLTVNSYTPCITLPTRIAETTATLIDHIYLRKHY